MSNVAIIQTNKDSNLITFDFMDNTCFYTCSMCGVNTAEPSLCANCKQQYDPKLEKIVCILCDAVVCQSFKKTVCFALGTWLKLHIAAICKDCKIESKYHYIDEYHKIVFTYKYAGRNFLIKELNTLNAHNYEVVTDIRSTRHTIICAELDEYLPTDISKLILSFCLYPRQIEFKN